MAAKMAMTLEQTRQAIIDRMQALPVLRKTESSIQIYQALRFQRKVCGAA